MILPCFTPDSIRIYALRPDRRAALTPNPKYKYKYLVDLFSSWHQFFIYMLEIVDNVAQAARQNIQLNANKNPPFCRIYYK